MNKNINKATLVILFTSFFLSACSLFPPAPDSSSVTPTPTSPLVGNDTDEHGCIGSAGYQWCEPKQKCLRLWEEPCDGSDPTPSVDETEIIKITIKNALVAKHGSSANDLNVEVSKIENGFSQGGASQAGLGGGMWFAAKKDGQWNLVWDGNGVIMCQNLTLYPNFPTSMIPECYDESTSKMVVR